MQFLQQGNQHYHVLSSSELVHLNILCQVTVWMSHLHVPTWHISLLVLQARSFLDRSVCCSRSSHPHIGMNTHTVLCEFNYLTLNQYLEQQRTGKFIYIEIYYSKETLLLRSIYSLRSVCSHCSNSSTSSY